MNDRQILCLLAAGLLSSSGCKTVTQTHFFPGMWPSALNRSFESSKPVSTEWPSVFVEPVLMETGAAQKETGSEGIPTAGVLTDLLVNELQANGIKASQQGSSSQADYILVCTVPRLVYSERSGYPRQVGYAAELACQLKEVKTRRVVWQRNLEQVWDRKVLVNTMTKLPEVETEHTRILLEKCVKPAWNTMASGVSETLKSPFKIAREPESVPAENENSPETELK